MTTISRGVAACALTFCCLSTAGAATICVQNPQTGRFAPRPGSAGNAQDCARHDQAPAQGSAAASAIASVPAGQGAPTGQAATRTPGSWTLTAGHTIGQELAAWGEKAGWKVVWSMQKDWTVPASTVFPGDFKTAASAVITTLAGNGALIRAQFYDGNNTLVVVGPGVTPQ